MKKYGYGILCFVLMIAMPVCSAGAFVMVRNGIPSCVIVLRKEALTAERYAAHELISHLKRITGAEIPIRVMHYTDIPETGSAVLLGQGEWLKTPRFKNSSEEMEFVGDQGFVVKSYEDREPEVLIVGGKSPRGTLYAVYELLQRIGVRWYTKDVTTFPSYKTIDLGDIDISDLPCFDFREVSSSDVDVTPEWKMRLRLNTGYGFMEHELACSPVFNSIKIYGDNLIPVACFEEHPDLFPLVNDARSPEYHSRCFSNPDCAAVASDSVRAHLSRNPDATAVSIYFKDYVKGCECSECTLIRNKKKSESGLVLVWLNRTAEIVKLTHPNVLVELDASGVLESPPEVTEPADNVVIRLSPEDVDQLHFYEDSIDERTMEFMEHFRGWRRSNEQILVSHYCANNDFPPAPFPDFRQLFRTIDMYHYEFVEGCFFRCPSAPGLYIADAELRMWVLSELMWNRYRDGETLVREWMKGVYGNAWGPMMDYWKHIQKIAQIPSIRVTVYTSPLDYISDDWLKDADRMFQRAYALSLTDSTAHRYVRKARLSLWYIELLHALSSTSSIKNENEKYLDLLGKWVKEFREFGYQHISGMETCDEFADRFREVFDAE